MNTISITKKRFDSLEKYNIPNYVYNTEGVLYILPNKTRWNTDNKILKRLYYTSGDVFGNKLQTINSLIDAKDELAIDEIVFPEKIATVSGEIVGFTMPLVESINLKTALKSNELTNQEKINYLHQIGAILEKMKLRREYTNISEFYINDLHESNFIVDRSNKVHVIDIDSCKINGNKIFPSKYLSSKSFIKEVYKYQKSSTTMNNKYGSQECYDNEDLKYYQDSKGSFIPDENTDLFCYIVVILNYLYGENIGNFTLEEFYYYLEYLNYLGVPFELLSAFEKIVTCESNKNPYELLDSLIPYIPRTNKHVYKYYKEKSSYHK